MRHSGIFCNAVEENIRNLLLRGGGFRLFAGPRWLRYGRNDGKKDANHIHLQSRWISKVN